MSIVSFINKVKSQMFSMNMMWLVQIERGAKHLRKLGGAFVHS